MGDNANLESARRAFLKKCGKYAAVTPPAIALMLSASEQSFAQAISGGGGIGPIGDGPRGRGHGYGWHHGHIDDDEGYHHRHRPGDGPFGRGHDESRRS